MKRGDVILAFVEHVGSSGGKVRPALIVQNDSLNAKLQETVLAAITSNLSHVHEVHQLLIDISTTEGASSGLLHNSAVRCERLHVIPQVDVHRVIGSLSAQTMQEIDECLKSALGIV